ncbi:unnamed protein product [Zymoseptoria tritici ST99CH_3D1]|nr:unnamed protein product [Zymoseptoria tritici ST99CH_3D1]
MNGYTYPGNYSGDSMDNGDDQQTQDMLMMSEGGMMGQVPGGQSLDDIVNQNAKMIRRQSMPLPQNFGNSSTSHPQHLNADMRRISMLDYGSQSPANNFHYDNNTSMDQTGFSSGNVASGNVTPAAPSQQRSSSMNRRRSGTGMSLEADYNGQNYGNLMSSNAGYGQSPVHPSNTMDMGMASPYLDTNMGMNMDYGVEQNLGDSMPMGMYAPPQFNQNPSLSSPMHSTSPHQGTPHSVKDATGGNSVHTQYSNSHSGNTPNTVRHMSRPQSLHVPDVSSPAHGTSPLSHPPMTSSSRQQQSSARPAGLRHQSSTGSFQRPQQSPAQTPAQDRSNDQPRQTYEAVPGPPPSDNGTNYNPNNQGFAWEAPEGGWPSTLSGKTHMNTVYKNAYSSTGFDMLGVLMRIATRPNPQINIGSVDLSCAFVVCDAEKDDFPIVYCSDNFERLTGYTKHMILGRNCRFLQSPDGNVAPGVRRKYVDDDSVLYLKNMITARQESQISLINYRRGGQPFMNLLTMIPITWDSDQVKFFVGFQVDLVEQPSSVTNKNPDGSYSINYQRGMTMPRYVMNAPEQSGLAEYGQTIPRDDVSTILSTIGSGESDFAKRMWDKVLLENTDDVVHVLSLKGLFQWVSPSAARILEYEPSEIIGTALSSVCHPSDIVPVTRELKDTSSGASVNVVFRIRRKNSGYMWFEGHGSLHTEQGKGRKSIIMVGRERPVYTLSKADIVANGGIGENELWTKLSTSGMFLFVSSNVRQLLDRQPEELIGISIQSLMRTESKTEFGRILEHARTGKKASVKHEMINRRGQVLSAFTTLYPGDAIEGQKPTFIVAQTRLIKFSRGSQAPRPAIYPTGDRASSESVVSGATSNHPGDGQNCNSTSQRYHNTDGSAATYAGQNGLALGHQDQSLASDDNLFDELKTTKSSSWQYEIRQLEKRNRLLAEEVQSLIAAKKKRKRRKGAGNAQKDCANCHTRVTPEWRRGPSGQRDLCNSCGLRWAKLNGRVSPRTSSQQSAHSAASDRASKASASPKHVKHEGSRMADGTGAGGVGGGVAGDGKSAQKPTTVEGHGASMEGAMGVPAKIDEGVEPND